MVMAMWKTDRKRDHSRKGFYIDVILNLTATSSWKVILYKLTRLHKKESI
jgi:hypothetical protein